MNVTLRQLRVFIEVARLQSFSRAGDEIGLTQSAVSRCVRELEGEIGLKLIDRTTREVQLTDVGGNLVSSVSRLLTDLDDALREIREIGEQRRGRVVVAASPTVACRLMPGVVASCGRQFPYITLGLRDDVQSDVVRKVKSGEVDFGVIIGPFSADDLLSESLMTDSFCVVSRDDHPLAAQERVAWTTWRPAARHARLRVWQPADHRRRDAGIWSERHGGAGVGAFRDGFGLVEAGVGVSVLPWLALPLPAGAALVARPLVPRAERTVELVRRRDRSLSPAAEAVWGLIRQLPGRAEDLN
jgi:Transcriptional regulator